MANTLQIKRSNSTNTPTSLAYGELAYSQASDKLYIGKADGSSVEVIGGAGAFLRSDTNDTFGGNLTITGNLTVSGTTTTVDSNTVSIGDNILVLNSDATGSPSQNAGLEVERGSSDNAIFQFNESDDRFEFKIGSAIAPIKASNANLTGNIDVVGNLSVDGVSNLDNTDIDGTLTVDGSAVDINATSTCTIDNSNASNGITIGTNSSGVPVSIGHTTSETFINDNLNVTGDLVANGNIFPNASDGASLGNANREFSDLFLADGAIINLGDDQDVTLTHVADTGILLNSTRQLQFGDSGTYIHQSADGVLDLVSDTEIEINATTIDMNGAVDVSGALTVGGAFTSLGIDDNCTAERLQLADSSIAIMASGVTLSGFASGSSTLDKFVIDGGTF
tara:strand:- start:1375 stop:2553 length:1179 start_codon:yes stop_codon:yes gene_type:complete